MADVPGVSPYRAIRGPHGIGDEWFSFELRMRKRRLAKCLLRADLAIEDRNLDDARLALSEARDLDPESIEAGALEQRLEALIGANASIRHRRRTRVAAIAGAAGLLLLGGSAVALGVRYWQTGPPPAAVSTAAPVEPAAAGLTAPASVPAAKPRNLEVVFETVRVPEATPRIVEDMPLLPSVPGPPVADADPESEPVVLAVNRGTSPPSPPQTPEVGSELPLGALPSRPPAAPPVRLAAPPAPADDTMARSEMPAAVEPSAPEPSPPRDESSVVRAVLERYEHAYSSLDAVAASAVWPGVNKDALSRAFDGLSSQRVSLGSCDVAIDGPAARATCSGSATWEPKVGGGVHTAPRRWNFELRKSGDDWQIERAITR